MFWGILKVEGYSRGSYVLLGEDRRTPKVFIVFFIAEKLLKLLSPQ